MVSVSYLDAGNEARWERFVEVCPQATFFHKAGWKQVLEDAFGHDAPFLFAEEEGEITGLLPLGHIKSRLFGNKLISTPFCVYGGVAATTQAARTALLARAEDMARERKVDWYEERNTVHTRETWQRQELYVTFHKEIPEHDDAILKAIPRKQRAEVRKAIAKGLYGQVEDDPEQVWRIYSESVRNLGTPVFSRRYFRILKEVFGKDCASHIIVDKDGRAVSGVLNFFFRDTVLPYYGGATGTGRALSGTQFMYYDVMCHARRQGYTRFDFGRSKRGSGSFDFKCWFGFTPTPLFYESLPVGVDAIPHINPMNPKYRLFIAAWKRLPLPLSRLLGPLLSKDLG